MSEQYTDVFGYGHLCAEKITQGGQGVIYRTQTPNLILKLSLLQDTNVDVEEYNKQFEYVRLLPIPRGLHITLPLATLEDAPGYVMTLLDDMSSFDDAFNMEPPEDFTTPWLTENHDHSEVVEPFRRYMSSGGRRRRLEVFFRCACILAQLHGAGLVYCDISGNNIFMSTKSDFNEVWMIDADNLNWAGERSRMGGLQTPGYGAPEVMRGGSNTYYSDCYSFAVALFSFLYNSHPFEGPAAEDEDGDFQEELRDSGELPWIFDEDDDSNALQGLPRENFISPDMFKLFQSTFSEYGRLHPTERPLMPEWAWVLGKDLDVTVNCPHCGMDYDRTEFDECPWCDSSVPVMEMNSHLISKETDPFWTYKHEMEVDKPLLVPLRLLQGVRTADSEDAVFSAERISANKSEIKLGSFHRDWKFYSDTTKQELYGEVLANCGSWIRCEQGKNVIWIEVRFHEAK